MQSSLEISANMANVAAIFLARKNNIHTWWTSILGCTLFAIVFFNVNLYADVTLQCFFIIMSIYGWINWQRIIHGEPLRITRVAKDTLYKYVFFSLLVTAGYAALLYYLTDASFPFMDSIILVLSIVAQFLLMNRKLENWLFWIVVNIIAVPVYYMKGLTLTSVLYGVFLINAIYGFHKWQEWTK